MDGSHVTPLSPPRPTPAENQRLMQQQRLLNLPVEVWLAILDHLSLDDAAALHTALASSAIPVDFSVMKRFAVNVISRILAFEKCKATPSLFSDNGPCYKFRMAHQRAGNCLHREDGEGNPPCGGWYDPGFSRMEFSRTFPFPPP